MLIYFFLLFDLATVTKLLENHPDSLRIFFATEMWERYGFYVVQSLLALYMALHMHWPDDRIYELVGSFTAITYISPIIGGWIADHLLGQKRTVFFGAVFLFFSYITLTLISSTMGLITALAGVAVGTGLLKPNISSLLGNQYSIDSPQRESGFTIFYMGITTGIILGTTIPSILNNYFGWGASFFSAAFGMIIAGLVFVLGMRHYKIADYYPINFTVVNGLKALMLIASVWVISFFILLYPRLADISFGLIVLCSGGYLLYSYYSETGIQARQTLVIGLLCIISIIFWGFYFQMFMSLTLFIARVVNPTFLGLNFPPPYYVSIQSIGMLVFGYYFSRTKTPKTDAHSGIRTSNKFLLSIVFMVLAYSLITLICRLSTDGALLSPILFIPIYLIISVSELLLSPIGLAAITQLASRRKVSTMMGIFFVSLGLGGFMSGKLALITAVSNLDNQNLISLKQHYAHTFSLLLIILLALALFSFMLNRLIKKLLS